MRRDAGGDAVARVSRPFHVMTKPTGAMCNLDCEYCVFLSKEQPYPGSTFRVSAQVQAAYLTQLPALPVRGGRRSARTQRPLFLRQRRDVEAMPRRHCGLDVLPAPLERRTP